MARESHGAIEDEHTYTAAELGRRIGRSRRWVQEFIRDNEVPRADLGNGLEQVSGRLWRLSMERLSEIDEEKPDKPKENSD